MSKTGGQCCRGSVHEAGFSEQSEIATHSSSPSNRRHCTCGFEFRTGMHRRPRQRTSRPISSPRTSSLSGKGELSISSAWAKARQPSC